MKKIFLATLLILLSFFQAHPMKVESGRWIINDPEKSKGEDTIIGKQGNGIYLFAVCDGHGGYWVSEHIQEHFAGKFYDNLEKNDGNIKRTLEISIRGIEEEVLRKNFYRYCGSTFVAVVCDTKNGKWFTANVGDSRAGLFNCLENKFRFFTRDHSPFKNKAERIRVLETGGVFGKKNFGYYGGFKYFHGKIDEDTPSWVYLYPPDLSSGSAMTRMIGDLDLKLKKNRTPFIATPEIEEINIKKGDYFIICSDGIWDVYDHEEKIKKNLYQKQTLKDILLENIETMSPKKLAKELCENAAKKWRPLYGRQDDISAIIVKVCVNESSSEEDEKSPQKEVKLEDISLHLDEMDDYKEPLSNDESEDEPETPKKEVELKDIGLHLDEMDDYKDPFSDDSSDEDESGEGGDCCCSINKLAELLKEYCCI